MSARQPTSEGCWRLAEPWTAPEPGASGGTDELDNAQGNHTATGDAGRADPAAVDPVPSERSARPAVRLERRRPQMVPFPAAPPVDAAGHHPYGELGVRNGEGACRDPTAPVARLVHVELGGRGTAGVGARVHDVVGRLAGRVLGVARVRHVHRHRALAPRHRTGPEPPDHDVVVVVPGGGPGHRYRQCLSPAAVAGPAAAGTLVPAGTPTRAV